MKLAIIWQLTSFGTRFAQLFWIIPMITDTQKGKELLNEVAYKLVSKQAPEELPLYVENRDQYLADPESFPRSSQSEDEVLAIGEVTIIKTLTKIVFPLLAPILEFLIVKVTEAFQEELGEEAADWVKKLFNSNKPPQPIFTQSDLEIISNTISEIANNEAIRLGLDPLQARSVSDAVIARLALAKM